MKINPFAGAGDPTAVLSKAADNAGQALAAARQDRKAKSDDLEAAQKRHTEAQDAWSKAYDGRASDTAKAAAAASLAACAKDVAGCEQALERADEHLAQLTAEADAAALKVTCEKVARVHEATACKVDALKPEAEAFFGRLSAVSAEAAPAVAIAHGLEIFAPSARAEVDVALTAIADELRQLARAVRDGRAKPILQKTAPALVPAAPTAPPKDTLLVFVLNPCLYTDPVSGEKTRIGRGNTARLLPGEAAIGIRRGKVAPHDPRDPRQKAIASAFSSALPEFFHCYDLTTDSMSPQPDITLSHPAKSTSFDPAQKMFERIPDKSYKPYTAVKPAPMAAAARKSEEPSE